MNEKIDPQGDTDKPKPTEWQLLRTGWLKAMIREAEQNANHPAWRIIEAAWQTGYGTPGKGERVAMCLGAVEAYVDGRERPGAAERSLLWCCLYTLRCFDPAFDDLAEQDLVRVLNPIPPTSTIERTSDGRAKGGAGNVGLPKALATLILLVGAFDQPKVTGRPTKSQRDKAFDLVRKSATHKVDAASNSELTSDK